ncbi:SpoIIE family protein phosphatase [Mobilitalea sibirica]|uniref:SpoIIE family protein phosphatase n=1 Tax=Mobilitalea sibirica TaxID=1462919 RepID=A0A8J7H8Z5_9FIRM|nr:SpoIIE family protein phosphatase [Mobilitalea sibirica]MBH1940670.1 SpoIIE family protein phosphatase [Mobilitalea sibirica]
MNNLCTDIGYLSLNKYSEQLCGDHVEIVEQNEGSLVMVLADGLGSGVKANILSTLTAKIISTMMANHMSLENCVTTVASTLPVCEKRGIAYSTFTIIHVIDSKKAQIIQYDNPSVILLRNGKNLEYDQISMQIGDKTIYKSEIELMQDDVLIAMSDGAVYAGVGKALNFGWQRHHIIEYIEQMYEKDFSAKMVSTVILDQCSYLYGGVPGDDTTIASVKIRARNPINLLIGPPANPEEISKMLTLFFAKEGKHIICGGTTSSLAANYLKRELKTELEYVDPDIPPISYIEGVDLVTEGVITINRVLYYAKNYLEDNVCYTEWSLRDDAASLISRLLFEEATDINFYVGRAINPAHQNPSLPIHFSIKMRLIDELSDCLKKMGKRVVVSYF